MIEETLVRIPTQKLHLKQVTIIRIERLKFLICGNNFHCVSHLNQTVNTCGINYSVFSHSHQANLMVFRRLFSPRPHVNSQDCLTANSSDIGLNWKIVCKRTTLWMSPWTRIIWHLISPRAVRPGAVLTWTQANNLMRVKAHPCKLNQSYHRE